MEAMKMELTLRAPRERKSPNSRQRRRVCRSRRSAGPIRGYQMKTLPFDSAPTRRMALMLALGMRYAAAPRRGLLRRPGIIWKAAMRVGRGLWFPRAEPNSDSAFYIDDACRFVMIEVPKNGGPTKRTTHIPELCARRRQGLSRDRRRCLEGGGRHQTGLWRRSRSQAAFYYARYVADKTNIDVYPVDSQARRHPHHRPKIDGTVSKTTNELHVFVSGDAAHMLEILRGDSIFADKPKIELVRSRSFRQANSSAAPEKPSAASNHEYSAIQRSDRRSRRPRWTAEREDDRSDRDQGRTDRPAFRLRLKTIEATSFVSPKWVPQLADAAEVYTADQESRACVIRCWCRMCKAMTARALSAQPKSPSLPPRAKHSTARTSTPRSMNRSNASCPYWNARKPTTLRCAATSRPCWAALIKATFRSPMSCAWPASA